MNHHRKYMRLEGYNYSNAGFYFITICVTSVETPLSIISDVLSSAVAGDVLSNTTTGLDGAVAGDVLSNTTTESEFVRLTDIGVIVDNIIRSIHEHYEHVLVSDWVLMPDHVHLLLQFKDTVDDLQIERTEDTGYYSKISPHKRSLGVAIRQFKAVVTGTLRKEGVRNFKWQRNYYDHIVRNEEELHRIRQYIKQNPQKLLLAQMREHNTTSNQ
ncbi:MAG: hypothetical protein GY928_16845 [Colwellia sp.]|nr:hypothetical protein [Colwellia sp.]